MKSNTKKRLIAFMLCMVLVLSSATSAFADEPQNTDSQSQAEVVTEPVADEATGDEANTTDIEIPSEKEWSVQVGNATVKVKGSADALPENAQLSVSEITSEDEVKEIEKAVEEKAIEEQFSIKNIFSYDIKFLVDGTEVQPTTPVQVSVDTPEITSDQNAAVLHVDDNNVAEDMNGAVDGEGKVVFDAPHFSKYVIVQKGDSEVTVTIEHYDNTKNPQEKIYADDVLTLPIGGKINDYTKATNWDVESVKKVEKATDGTETTTTVDTNNELSVTKDCTIKVYYTPKTKDINGDTTFYDYTVKAGNDNNKYYSFNMLGDTPTEGKKLTAGTPSQNYDAYQYWNKDTFMANVYTGGNNVVKGILQGLDKDGKVKFNYPEPGFFEDSDAKCSVNGKTRYLRKVYKDLKLGFEQKGDTYTLKNVNKKNVNENNVTELTKAGDHFYPLDTRKFSYEQSETNNNNFFGMRYDVKFKIGDYIGPMNYTFTGDDDLWVLLDGKLILDLGGIHEAANETVDIWKKLGKEDGQLTDKGKEDEHTLTVLYMERGAGKSNCQMEFTLPNARVAQVTQEPLADFSFKKVNTKNEGLDGAAFRLTNTSDSTEVYDATSVTGGTVSFRQLREGTYTLEERVAPNGYSLSNETWIVKVSKTGDSAVATLYNSDGTTLVPSTNGVCNIVNQTQQEIIQSSMEHSKTATVKDWDTRTYNINIKAASTSTSVTTSTHKPVADIMLVLDVSGSMAEKIVTYNYVAMNTKEGRNGLDKKETYYLESNGKYMPLRYYEARVFKDAGWYVGNYRTTSADQYNADCKIYTASTTTRLDALKSSVNQFIDDTKQKSPTSKIGITAFSSEGYGDHGSTMDLTEVGVSNNAQDLKKIVNELNANGGTDPGVGLDKAKTELDTVANDGKTKCVVLFTDGEPTGGGSSWSPNAQESAETKAKELRDAGYTVYTIGFALNDKSKTFLAGGTYNKTEYPGIASSGCAKVADDAASLGEIFKEIENTITNDIDIVGATVTDVIDPRFVIVKDDGTVIKNEDLKDGNTIILKNGGVVSLDEKGNQVVTWTDQTIPNKKKGEWSNTITVKAKDDYIGGNNVPTNVTPDSKITTGYGEIVLPQPKVNVKAELTLNDKEITIYKGDDVPTADTVLADMVQNYTKNTTSYSISKNSFTVQWYSSEQLEENKKIDTAVIGTKVENDTTYYLTVTYNAGAPTKESNNNTTITKDDGSSEPKYAGNETTYQVVAAGDQNRGYGIYTIHVISGTIKITKKLTDSAKEDHTFYFEVKCGDTQIAKVPITVTKGKTTATITDEKLKALSRGTYTVTEIEENNSGYILNKSEVNNETNCQNSSENNTVTFVLGNSKESENVINNYKYSKASGGTLGDVTFTNEKVIKNWDIVKVSTSSKDVKLQGAEFTLTDSNNKTYTGTSGSDGKITWKGSDSKPVPVLPGGTYTFKETKAPVGYAVNSETWTIKISSTHGYLKSITKADGREITGTKTDSIVHYYFEDEAVYALPSAGGTGIYLYMIGGMFLMFAAAWILYKNKCKEVLGK